MVLNVTCITKFASSQARYGLTETKAGDRAYYEMVGAILLVVAFVFVVATGTLWLEVAPTQYVVVAGVLAVFFGYLGANMLRKVANALDE